MRITKEVVDKFLRFFGISNKTFDFGADLDHDPDPGNFNGILPLTLGEYHEFCGIGYLGGDLRSLNTSSFVMLRNDVLFVKHCISLCN